MLWGSMTTVNMTIKVPAFIAEATIVMFVLSMLHKKPAKQRQSCSPLWHGHPGSLAYVCMADNDFLGDADAA